MTWCAWRAAARPFRWHPRRVSAWSRRANWSCELATSGQAIYGLNSALGANTGAVLAEGDLEDYQRRAVRARAVAVGPAYDKASVRAMQFARIAGLSRGGSGVSPAVLDACINLLNFQVHPVVPRFGSIGVADLPQLSHLALPLFGEGQAEVRGEILGGAAALERAGLEPVTLGAKDGLALDQLQRGHHGARRAGAA
jgi:histidine ammonia-lyase